MKDLKHTLSDSGELDERIDALEDLLTHCSLCPWECKVNRKEKEKGICQAGDVLMVAKTLPHFGEEPVLTGNNGSGTIFFTHCHLQCQFCQNYQISQEHLGHFMNVAQLADTMIVLQAKGCHNINFVSPTHFLPIIVKALKEAFSRGLTLPLVYNSNGYEKAEVLRLLDGVIDIYLPDAKYGDDRQALKFSKAQHYTRHNIATLQEMYRQVGPLQINENGIAEKGLIIRHLVLPHNLSGTEEVLKMIKEHIGTGAHISLMGQYFPTYRAHKQDGINRRLTRQEYQRCLELLDKHGFENGWCQEPEKIQEEFVPDFTKQASWN
ncbi:MAG: radical SAM protein [Deltaproteobacteria bacterium]|nr:radical SAM protein [Deltaproteobacteria bacterium]